MQTSNKILKEIRQRKWRKGHPHYSRDYYRTKMNPYFYLQFFKRISLQQKMPKRCPKGHIIPKWSHKCPICIEYKEQQQLKRQTRKKHPSKYVLRQREIRETYQINRKWVIEQLGGKCLKCGFDDILALDIHHEKGKKPKSWSKRKRDLFYYWKKQGFIPEEERKNMKLWCANCHRIYHGELSRNYSPTP